MWTQTEKYLEKEFVFKDFVQAIEFVNQIASLAEQMNHHPDILIFDYKKVKISLFTHDANRVTEKDHKLAKSIDDLI